MESVAFKCFKGASQVKSRQNLVEILSKQIDEFFTQLYVDRGLLENCQYFVMRKRDKSFFFLILNFLRNLENENPFL